MRDERDECLLCETYLVLAVKNPYCMTPDGEFQIYSKKIGTNWRHILLATAHTMTTWRHRWAFRMFMNFSSDQSEAPNSVSEREGRRGRVRGRGVG